MVKMLLWTIFVLTVVLAFGMLNELQHLPFNENTARAAWSLTAFGYGSAAMAFLSGASLVLLAQK